MFENESVQDLMDLAMDTPYGKTCSALWAEAARRAGVEGLEREEIWCYLRLAQAFTMGGEVTRMVAPFMWVDKRRKERPDLFDADMQDSFAWYYKYVILVLRDVPQASADECFNALREMREFYQSLGDSLKAYYLREYYIFSMLGRDEEADEAYRKWKIADVSEHSDCVACDPQHEVAYYSQRGEWDKAVEVGEEALANSQDSCSSQPSTLYCNMLLPWLYTGQDDKAWPAHIHSMQRNSHSPAFLEYIAKHFVYLELSGSAGRPQRLERALDMVVRFMPWWLEAETPVVLMDVATASARVMAAQPDQDRHLEVTLPGQSLPWVKADDVVNPTVAEAAAWYADLALRIAHMFDQRPGLVKPHMVARVEHNLYHMPPVPQLPDEGPIQDASGRFSPVTFDYRLEGVGETLSAASAVDTDEDEPLIVSIDINGPWRSYSPEQLEAAHAALNTSLPSIYSGILGKAIEIDLETAAEADTARALLIDALRFQVHGQYLEAAQAADTAMRTATEEPIGVRLLALKVLAETALNAGYYDESAEASRHRLNVAAACGLPFTQVNAAVLLVTCLNKQQQFTEAAEVAHTTLSATAAALQAPDYDPLLLEESLALRRLLITALDALDHDTAAAEEALRMAELCQDNGDKVEALTRAMAGFRYDHEYERSFAAGTRLVDAAESLLLEAQARAVVDPDAEENLSQVVSRVVDVLLDVAWSRSTQSTLVDDAGYEFIESVLARRLELQQQYLITDKREAEFYRADNTEDRGLAALRSRRYLDGLLLLDDAAQQFVEIGRPHLAARALNSAARAKGLHEDYDGAREIIQRSLDLLVGTVWESHKSVRQARELLAEIDEWEAEESDD